MAIPLLAALLAGCQSPPKSNAFTEQLALAAKEGIPLTFAEIAAQVPKVADADNAAPLYRKLQKRNLGDALLDSLAGVPGPENLDVEMYSALVAKHAEDLRIIEEASAKPGCNFNRKWEEGFILLFPEMSDIKAGAKLLATRAAISADDGEHGSALRDLQSCSRIAHHVSSEPSMFAAGTAQAIYGLAVRQTVKMAIAYPEISAYVKHLDQAIKDWPKHDAAQNFANEFPALLEHLSHANEADYMMDIYGVPSEELPDQMTVGTGAEQIAAKAKIVELYRRCYQSFSLKQAQSDLQFGLAYLELLKTMQSRFPGAYFVYYALAMPLNPTTTSQRLYGPVDALIYRAAYRAIKAGCPQKLDVSDLRIPYDDIPLEYVRGKDSFTIHAKIPSIVALPDQNYRAVEFKIPKQ